MADRKATFAKRQRETELKDRAREKDARRVARRAEPRVTKGPEIAWDEAVRYVESPMPPDLTASDAEVVPDGPSAPGETPAADARRD